MARDKDANLLLGFNSLQTGRSFRTNLESAMEGYVEHPVSIPFKREGLSELITDKYEVGDLDNVSIPFKREGLSEPIFFST